MSPRPDRPARFGPFHRRLYFEGENQKIAASGQVWGKPRGNVYAGDTPAVKAWKGSLPTGIAGTEFYTDVEPDPWSVPSSPEWSEDRPGVITLERKQLVAITVVVTKQVSLEQANADSETK